MNRKDLKVGEIYAFQTHRRDSPYFKPAPVRIVSLYDEIVLKTYSDGSVRRGTGIIIEYLDSERLTSLGWNHFICKDPRHLWRTWADQVVKSTADEVAWQEQRAATRALEAEARAKNCEVWSEIRTILGSVETDARFGSWFQGTPNAETTVTAEELLQMFEIVRRRT
jgi:hypothetical protein